MRAGVGSNLIGAEAAINMESSEDKLKIHPRVSERYDKIILQRVMVMDKRSLSERGVINLYH